MEAPMLTYMLTAEVRATIRSSFPLSSYKLSPGRMGGFVVVVRAAERLILLDQHLLLTQGLTSQCVCSRFNISQNFLIYAACATQCRYTSFCPEINNKPHGCCWPGGCPQFGIYRDQISGLGPPPFLLKVNSPCSSYP